MAIVLIILYWVLVLLLVAVSLAVVYHIWAYYLNRSLAIFTIILFLVVTVSILFINFSLASKIDLNISRLFL